MDKSTMGWFYVFKLHLIVNDKGGLVKALITPENVMIENQFPKWPQISLGTIWR